MCAQVCAAVLEKGRLYLGLPEHRVAEGAILSPVGPRSIPSTPKRQLLPKSFLLH